MTTSLGVVGKAGQPEIEKKRRLEICRIGRWMYKRGYVVACEGNLSARIDSDRILLTPAGACKGHLVPDNLVLIDLDGTVICGSGRPSSETRMHLLYYNSRADVRAVCHAHPPTATGFAAAGRGLEAAVLPEVVVGLGTIPLAPYGTPGTWELCAGLEPLVKNHDAILLENHGVVTSGQDLATAFQRLETVEQFARILLTAESLGGPNLLPRAEVQKLIATRSRYGVSCPEGGIGISPTSEPVANRLALTRPGCDPIIKAALQRDHPLQRENSAFHIRARDNQSGSRSR